MVKTHYKRVIKKAQRLREGGKKISELNRLRNEEIACLDSPILERYFLARKTVFEMNDSKKIDYGHLIRTFVLSCRQEFHCLDANERVKNYKTPVRRQKTKAPLAKNTTTKIKKVKQSLRTDIWKGEDVFR